MSNDVPRQQVLKSPEWQTLKVGLSTHLFCGHFFLRNSWCSVSCHHFPHRIDCYHGNLCQCFTQLKTFFTHFYGRYEYRHTWKNLCEYYETSDEISNNDNWIFTIWRLHNAGQGSLSVRVELSGYGVPLLKIFTNVR